MTGALFEISFVLAAPFWLLMIFLPGRAVTARVAASPLTVLPVLAVYLAMAVPVLPELWTAVSSPDIDTFRDLTALSNGAGAVWAQVIAWDLLLGQWMFLESHAAGNLAVSDGPAAGADDSALAVRAAALPGAARGPATRNPARKRTPGPGGRCGGGPVRADCQTDFWYERKVRVDSHTAITASASSAPPRLSTRPRSGSDVRADRLTTIAQLTGLKSAM